MIKFFNPSVPETSEYKISQRAPTYAFRDWKCIGKECFTPRRIYMPQDMNDNTMLLSNWAFRRRKRSKFPVCAIWKLVDSNCPPLPYSEELMRKRIEQGWKSFAL